MIPRFYHWETRVAGTGQHKRWSKFELSKYKFRVPMEHLSGDVQYGLDRQAWNSRSKGKLRS